MKIRILKSRISLQSILTPTANSLPPCQLVGLKAFSFNPKKVRTNLRIRRNESYFLKLTQKMSEPIPEASVETLKFFASSSKFRELLEAIVEDNVATVEAGDDLDALKKELELEATATVPLTDIIGQQEVDNCHNSILLTFDPLADDQKTAADVLGNKARVRFWMIRQGPNAAETPDEVTITFLGTTGPTGVQTCFRMFIRARKARSNVDVAALRVMTRSGATMINADLRRFIPSSAILWSQVQDSTWAVPCNARSEMDRLRAPATPSVATPTHRETPRPRASKGGAREESARPHEVIDPSDEEAENILQTLNPQIQILVARQVRIALAKQAEQRERESEFSGDRDSSFHQSDRQAGEAARLRAVEGLFAEDKFADKLGDGSPVNRLEGFASRFIAFVAMRMFHLSKHWTINAAKHFVCCDWTIGGSSASVGLHMFTPMGRINDVGDFVIACANWAECEAWLRGFHMRIHINAMCMRLVHLSCDEPQIGGRELATAVEVMAMNLRQPCERRGGVTPVVRVQEAMLIPETSVDENRTLARFIRRNASYTSNRESSNHQRGESSNRAAAQQQHAKPHQGGRGPQVTGKRSRDRSLPPVMATAPKQQMCYEWVAKGEPATCPSRRGTACKWDHAWGTASEPDKVLIRAHANRPRDNQP